MEHFKTIANSPLGGHALPSYPRDAPRPGTRFWRRVFNSYLQPHWLYELVVRDQHYNFILDGRGGAAPLDLRVQWQFAKIFPFWPRISEARAWAKASRGGEHDPSTYTDWTVDSAIAPDWVMAFEPNLNAAILDLGCNTGRHLDHLFRNGYRNLHGVDASAAALDLMRERYPEMAAVAAIKHDLFQRFLTQAADEAYDVVYTNGITVESVHPAFPLVRHVCRVTRKHVVFLIEDKSPPYPRCWSSEFTRHGFAASVLIDPVSVLAHDKQDRARGSVLQVFSRTRA
jgi:SAM-dependent methyltransferase